MIKSKPIMAPQLNEDRPSLDYQAIGVKTYNEMRKNANSVNDYHIVSNLTNV